MRLVLVFLAATLVLGLTSEGVLNNVDSDQYLAQARAVWEDGSLAIPDRLASGHVAANPRSSRDGKLYMKVGLGTVVTYGPFVGLAHGLSGVTGIHPDRLCQITCSIPNVIAGGLLATYVVWALILVGVPRRRATILGCATIFGTYLWAMTKISHVDIQQAACMFAAFAHLLAFRSRARMGHLLASSVWAGMAVLLKLSSLPALAPIFLYALFVLGSHGQLRISRVIALVTVPALALLLTAMANYLKFGSPMSTGYPAPGQGGEQTYTLAQAVWGSFFSPDRSLFLYAPILVLVLPALPVALVRRRAETLAALGVFAAFFAVLLAWFRIWHGGSCYGPRYLSVPVPFLWFAGAAVLGHMRSTLLPRVVTIVLIACAIGQIPAVSVPYYEVEVARRAAATQGWTGIPAALSDRRPGQYEFDARLLLALTGPEVTYGDLGFSVGGTYASRSGLARRFPFWFLRLREFRRES